MLISKYYFIYIYNKLLHIFVLHLETNITLPMKITIEKGVKLPPSKIKYPWGEMKKGESFVACDYTREAMQALSASIQYQKKKYKGRYWVVRKMDGAIRVFRIK